MHASKHRHVASSKPSRYGPGCAVRAKRTIFLILTFSKLILKLTPAKYYLHPVTPLAAPGGVAWQASFAVPHAAARQGCHASQAWHAGQTWAQACRATCSSTAALPRHPTWRGSVETTGPARPPFFFLLPFFSPSLEAVPPLTAAPHSGPNRWIWGGKSGGNRSPPPCEGIPLLLSLFYRCIM
jgi:hypothetical protein